MIISGLVYRDLTETTLVAGKRTGPEKDIIQ